MSSDTEWSADCTVAVCALAATNRQFTVDEVWDWLVHGSKAAPPTDAKALGGIVHHLSSRLNVMAPVQAWCTSVRKPDRPIRMWVGTGTPHPTVEPTEDQILLALQAVERVGQERSRMLLASIRQARHEPEMAS